MGELGALIISKVLIVCEGGKCAQIHIKTSEMCFIVRFSSKSCVVVVATPFVVFGLIRNEGEIKLELNF